MRKCLVRPDIFHQKTVRFSCWLSFWIFYMAYIVLLSTVPPCPSCFVFSCNFSTPCPQHLVQLLLAGFHVKPTPPLQECWCKDKPDHGSFFCCQDCPAKDGPSVDYHLEYVVTYRCSIRFAVTARE